MSKHATVQVDEPSHAKEGEGGDISVYPGTPPKASASYESAVDILQSVADTISRPGYFNDRGNTDASVMRSMGTNGSLNNSNPNAYEVSISIRARLLEMSWCFFALVINLMLFWLDYSLITGFNVPIDPGYSASICCVILELFLIITNMITQKALESAFAAYIGYLFSKKKGYSMAACGFVQSNSTLEKLMFAGQLSLNSTCREFLSRISLTWIILNLLLIISPITATAMYSTSARTDRGTVECILFQESGSPTDRQYPVIIYESGITEMLFGTALGVLRSETNTNVTLTATSPQIVGAVADGDTLLGAGFTVNISTRCQCAPTADVAGLAQLNLGSAVNLTKLVQGYNSNYGELGLSNFIDGQQDKILITTVISGTTFCGGTNVFNPATPVCITTMSDHYNAKVLVAYMTDGTTASIAQRKVEIVEMGAPANLSWVTAAMTAIVETQYSNFSLPPPVPSMVNPLMWWTTSNLLSVDPTLLEAGLETLWATLYRAGVQRTYAVTGDTCTHNIAIDGTSSIAMYHYGIQLLWIFAGIQVAVTLVAIAGFVPWLMSDIPLSPAIRMAKNSIYFTTLLLSTSLFNSDTLCNSPPHVIWQALDNVVRVGETFKSRDDNIVGQISMDRPKFISPLTNGKRYN